MLIFTFILGIAFLIISFNMQDLFVYSCGIILIAYSVGRAIRTIEQIKKDGEKDDD